MKSITSFKSVLYRGILATILGLICIFTPGFTIETLIIIIGVAICLAGITSFWFRIKNPHKNSAINFLHLTGATLNFIFGLVLIIMPDRFQEVFIILFGIVIIIAGLVQLFSSLSVSPINTHVKIFLGLAILTIILGTIFIFDVFEKDTARIIFFGIIVSIYGITNIVMSFWIRIIHNNAQDELEKKTDNVQDVDYEMVEEKTENMEGEESKKDL